MPTIAAGAGRRRARPGPARRLAASTLISSASRRLRRTEVLLARWPAERDPQIERLGERRLGDDEPAGPRADPRRPLLRPHADPPRGRPEARSASRSTPASPSAPASTRPPPAASRRSICSNATVASASQILPTSAPAPACSPSRRWRCGRRRKRIATDIDPIAVEVTRDNAAINRVPLGHGAGRAAARGRRRHGSPAARRPRAVRPAHRQHPRRPADRARPRLRQGARARRAA